MYDLNDDDSRLLREVLARASTDATFRRELLEHPHDAVRAATGVALPAELSVRFVEQPADVDAYIVLPRAVVSTEELTPEELEAVAGGAASAEAICWDTCGTTCDKSCSNTCAVTEITPVLV